MSQRNYNQSTIDVIGDLKLGMICETGIQPYTALAAGNYSAFTVTGRIVVYSLWFEVTTLWANASTLKFTYAMTVPGVIAAADLTGACSSMDTFAAGRIVYAVGTLTSTAAVVLPANPGIATNILCAPMKLGMVPVAGVLSVGQLGFTIATSPATASAGKMGVMWAPIDAGASVVALI